MELYRTPDIMDVMDNMIFEDRKRKYSNALIVRIIMVLQIYGISYRSLGSFFRNHKDIMEALGIHEIPNFRTLSRRARMFDWHYISALILDLVGRPPRILPYLYY